MRSGYRRREWRRGERQRAQCRYRDRVGMLQIRCLEGRQCEQRRKMQAAVAVVRMSVRIRLVGRMRVMRMSVVLLVKARRVAIVRHVDRVEYAFEPRREQAHSDQN